MTKPPFSWTFLAVLHPTFLDGMARLLDIGGTLGHNWLGPKDFGLTPAEYDTMMLRADWDAIASDLRKAGLPVPFPDKEMP